MLQVTPHIAIDEAELQETFIRASGPGGQNVNKVSTAVQLRFDVLHSPSLPEDVRQRLLRQATHQISDDGVLTIKAMRFRTQDRNREDARARLIAAICRAAVAPVARRATRPTRASRQERLESKRRRSMTKQARQGPAGDD
jgi:ribosome-associated protein